MSTDALSYEQARTELAEVVEKLEAGGVALEESLVLWERGEVLADLCQAKLDGARERLDTARAARQARAEGRDG
ncbi:MAG TPA: exodeoxyribonuclease VII small subunit [Micromonosporaceae bacterium]